MRADLQKKIDTAIRLLQSVAPSNGEAIEVAYSGGKDSDIILQLVKESGIKYRAIYTPKGAALEYGKVGCNFYTGCPHDCEYCYLKRGAPAKLLGSKEVRLKSCFKDT